MKCLSATVVSVAVNRCYLLAVKDGALNLPESFEGFFLHRV